MKRFPEQEKEKEGKCAPLVECVKRFWRRTGESRELKRAEAAKETKAASIGKTRSQGHHRNLGLPARKRKEKGGIILLLPICSALPHLIPHLSS